MDRRGGVEAALSTLGVVSAFLLHSRPPRVLDRDDAREALRWAATRGLAAPATTTISTARSIARARRVSTRRRGARAGPHGDRGPHGRRRWSARSPCVARGPLADDVHHALASALARCDEDSLV